MGLASVCVVLVFTDDSATIAEAARTTPTLLL